MNRRDFLRHLSAAVTAVSAMGSGRAAESRPPRILLRGSWQTVNIGDIGHTPGMLRLLEEHLPEAEVRLWPGNVGDGVEELLLRRFPKLVILKGEAAIKQAFQECDFLLHGSSSGFAAQKHVKQWRDETGKPYGIYGITLVSLDPEIRELIEGAQFTFFRDGVSASWAKSAGLTCPLMGFAPDSAFGVDLRNDAAADGFLSAHGLEPGKFLCCIPRYRYTPYWKIHPGRLFDAEKDQRNEAMKEHDHAPLREAIAAVVRETPFRVLVCPEDQSQMELGRALVVDPLPAEVKARVVWRENYWLTDEAVSTYVRSAGVFGLEMHSPIMAIANGVPAIVCRFKEQTNKGFMWRDIGLNDWLFDLDTPADVAKIAPTVLSLAQDPAAARARAAQALEIVRRRQRETMGDLVQACQAAVKARGSIGHAD